jgi:hypothetical protein
MPQARALAALGLILLVGGIVMMVYYQEDDRHANAHGYIVGNSDCLNMCSSRAECVSVGTVAVLYQYDSDDAHWYDASMTATGFCDYACCESYIAGNVSVYFFIDDGAVMYTSTTLDSTCIFCWDSTFQR